jgi:alkanesulfonate monooxygenase SsuD/methylene tetrahydromethanopterin reductase-like flavin-dependent oxidoreductase (luciferase family)
MTRPCKIGVQLPEVERFVPWPELIAMARSAEEVGFDSIWLGDHLLYDLPDGTVRARGGVHVTRRAGGRHLACAARFAGCLAGFHEPAMLAKMAATVDGIRGRLILGVGAGWNRRGTTPTGSRTTTAPIASRRLSVIRRLLAGDTVTTPVPTIRSTVASSIRRQPVPAGRC